MGCNIANLYWTTFVPLNVETEEESEDEIDDSKEIQVSALYGLLTTYQV
jgi:hypothetical protein